MGRGGGRTPRKSGENIVFGEFKWGCVRGGLRLYYPQESLGGRRATMGAETGGAAAKLIHWSGSVILCVRASEIGWGQRGMMRGQTMHICTPGWEESCVIVLTVSSFRTR